MNLDNILPITASLAMLFLPVSGTCAISKTVPDQWDAYVADFIESYFAAHPDAAVASGRHEFDGKLPDWSRAGLAREVTRLRAERARALAFSPADMDERQRFEREYVIAVIEGKLFWLATAEWPFKNPVYYEYALDPHVYVAREYASPQKRMKAYIDYARGVPRAVSQIRSNLQQPLPKSFVEIGHTLFSGFALYYETDAVYAFSSVRDPKLQREFRAANLRA